MFFRTLSCVKSNHLGSLRSGLYKHCVTYACECVRAVGGREGEKTERQKWINRERKRIEDSVDGRYFNIKFNVKQIFVSGCRFVPL